MLFGYEEKTALFKELAESGKMGHAYLFFGDTGVGKRTFARMFANFLEQGTFTSSSSPFVDTIEILPDEKGVITIDAARRARRFLFEHPFRSSRRIVIIGDVATMTDQAEAAMLKIVEEPPSHALIIFTGEHPSLLFPPLASRLTKVYFSRMSASAIVDVLKKHYAVSVARAKEIARVSFGRMGRALEILNGVSTSSERNVAEAKIEEIILMLRNEDVRRHVARLAWLLDREMQVKRYNLNPTLQLKAIHQNNN